MNTVLCSYPQVSHLKMEPIVGGNFNPWLGWLNPWLGWLNPWMQARRAHYMFIEKNPCISEPMWFKPVLQQSTVYL